MRGRPSYRGPSSATTPCGTSSPSFPKRTPPKVHVCHTVNTSAEHLGLTAARTVLSPTEWEAASAPFLGDLRIDPDDLFKLERLTIAYAGALEPQLAIARTIGFEADWRFTK